MKSQTWSPDQLGTGDDFQFRELDPAALPKMEAVAEPSKSLSLENFDGLNPEKVAQDISPKEPEGRFASSPGFWDALLSDPSIREEFDALVEARVVGELDKRYREILPTATEEAMRKGHDEGLSKGLEKGTAQGLEEGRAKGLEEMNKKESELLAAHTKTYVETMAVLNDMLGKFNTERNALLRSHEKAWGLAMTHLLKRFQVDRAAQLGHSLQQWLANVLPGTLVDTPVKILVNEDDLAGMQKVLTSHPNVGWSVHVDGSIPKGTTRYQVEKGGVAFDAENEYTKLLEWVNREP